jgi:hypothetical protein
MGCNETLVGRIRTVLRQRSGVAEKTMFGGVAFLLNGNMCCGVHKDRLIVRLGTEAGDQALTEPHTRPMDITGKPMKGWIIVASEGVREDGILRQWIEQAVAFVATLPRKPGSDSRKPSRRRNR